MVEWPEPYTISKKARKLKRRFVESFTSEEGEDEKVRDLNYIVAVSSGKAVTEEIPKQIGRRAGWASQQGANFVELLIENPAQLVMDEDMLLNLSRQLNLHYNIHSSTSMAYGMSYRRGRGNGFDSAHEYTVKLLKSIRNFREELEKEGEEEDENGHPRLYAINGHMAVAQFPAEEERLAQDVSVGPYGEEITESDIFETEEAREQIWEGYIVPEILKVERRVLQFVLDELDLLGDFQDLQRKNLLDKLISEGVLPQRGEEEDYRVQNYNALGIAGIRRAAQQVQPEPRDPREEEPEVAFPEMERERVRELEAEAEKEAEEEAYKLAKEAVVGDREAMETVIGLRSIQQEIYKESTLFRHVIPMWMPHAQDDQVVQIWENITGITTKDIEGLTKEIRNGLNEPRTEEDIVAAATGAYVWGHFTQEIPGYEVEKNLMNMLEQADMYWSFESHMAGPAENARIWKPKDMIEVVKAINQTPVEVETEDGKVEERSVDRTRITIDMEHIASQKVDPIWVIDPDEEMQEKENYKGLEEGDGKYIMINHVTHPYITEEGHQHGPVRRGDTRVYNYIHKLVEKGMTTDPELPTVIMYEIGSEKDETLYMLRLILNMIEHGIEPGQLEGKGAAKIINKDKPEGLEEYLIQKFFGVTDTEVQHEWQEIHQHALDPLDDLLEAPEGGYTWMGQVATEAGTRPEDWEGEEYR
ncbi:MAG: hypothetical protein MUP63_02075 [Candidatus Nanohaloarchaeota archaeon QJJ-7]|nr:hypothetical protein [Candidatus Nanohaloarchaeota archaeon QJJ-7]